MLELITGAAGAGKTARVMAELRDAAARREGGRVLIVPEQYSHEAERELCRAAGDTASLYAEVLSFTGLARRVEDELGPGGRVPLDRGGRLLCMALALDAVGARLALYGAARRSPELQLQLLSALDELKAARLTDAALAEAAGHADGTLALKLSDLSLILGAYDAAVGAGRADPADRLTLLLEALPRSAFGRAGHLYLDGFTDFTRQELALVCALMGRGADMTVCLTCDLREDGSEVFALSRRTARALLREADSRGYPTRVVELPAPEETAPDFFAAHLFEYGPRAFAGDTGAVSLFRADTVTDECELAAAQARAFVRAGCRWRDIAVAVRGFEDYRPALEAAFAYYGVPLFTARRTDILSKPLPALIAGAYAVLSGGWEPDDVFSYLRTGLAGLSDDECDLLENYCLTWSVRAGMWCSDRDWRLHPDGYGQPFDEGTAARLAELNRLRRLVSGPLLALDGHAKKARTAREQAAALADFFAALRLPERLAARADALEAAGRTQAAAEYGRLWDLTVSALEQFTDLLGDAAMETETFSRLFLLTLSQYDIGIIPVSLDMVTAGDMDRMRRRHIRHLIVLGASDERLPRPAAAGGVFSDDERRALSELGLAFDAGDDELWREFTLLYNCLSLPAETLTLVTPAFSSDGAPARPSFVVSRAAALFGLPILPADMRRVKGAASAPALELAALALRSGREDDPALASFRRRDPGRLAALAQAAELSRGALSPSAVRALYGDDPRLSPSRAERFASCRFAFFLRYGLGAKPRAAAEFSPPEFGSFMHGLLQNVAEQVRALGGFRAVDRETLDGLTRRCIDRYIADELGGFEDRSPRFSYLFRRLTGSAERIVADMAEELAASDFQPLDFELDFSKLPADGAPRLSGIADRVDGWVKDGTLYLRVVDYKTGRRSFSLSDVWYGLGLQMLIYLFALEERGAARYGREVRPAGVLYIPARDVLVSADTDLPDEELAEKRLTALRRSGLLLDDPQVLHAMERGDAPVRIPVKWKGGVPTGDALASAERLGRLEAHVRGTLAALARELRGGSIAADPYYKGAQDNACLTCDYCDACRFSDGEGGDARRYLRRLPATRVWHNLEGGTGNA